MNEKSISLKNSITLQKEFNWLSDFIDMRLNNFFDPEKYLNYTQEPPSLEGDDSNLASYFNSSTKDVVERMIIDVALATYFRPELFDRFLIKNKPIDKPFTEFGGIYRDKNKFTPTLGTIAFIYYGDDLTNKFLFQNYLDDDHSFKRNNVVLFEDLDQTNSILTKTMKLGDEFLSSISTGNKYKPNYTLDFPANLLTTAFEWEDLVLDQSIHLEIDTINAWLKYNGEITEDKLLSKKMNLGYKCLFYGPPGTGKTLTASLIGKQHKLDVYRIDLSQMISKYIGETEKNLGKIFDMAENKNWILFFDEAESLFSKRTTVGDSKDKFANQQTAYLLQRIEQYNGLVILATNLKPNIDQAFSRRLQSFVNFSMPNASQRKKIWSKFLEGIAQIPDSDLGKLSKSYELSGGSIKNVIQFAWLSSKSKNRNIELNDLLLGVRREFNKHGKAFEK